MAMLTKLLVIKMVASNFPGFLNNDKMVLETVFFSSSSSTVSFEVREKNAISLPEINAEAIKRNTRKMQETIIHAGETEYAKNKSKNIPDGGSVSKID